MDKLWLMCTFHPGQTEEEEFFVKIVEAQDRGFNIGMCNYVMTTGNIVQYEKTWRRLLRHGIPLHPNPDWDMEGKYDEESLSILKRYLPVRDYLYRSGTQKTFKKKCLYPAIAYEMSTDGTIRVACHDHAAKTNFVKGPRLPQLYNTYTECPDFFCRCLDKYSFLMDFGRNRELNPLYSYKIQLLDLYKFLERAMS
ncbi:MAG: hypothetical protein HY589_05135 [Candidatus Omnitrophica bacterium]|nr:hypothetical protein [Candidatus Omnitrophota bacterium]